MPEEDEQTKRRFEQMENLLRKRHELQKKFKERKLCEMCKTTLDDTNFYGSIIYDDLIFPSVCRACAEEFIEVKLSKISMKVMTRRRAIISLKMFHRRRDKLLYTIYRWFDKGVRTFFVVI